MLGSVFAVVYASLTRRTPRAAASTIVRSSPVTRETSVAMAIVPAARRMPRLAPGAPSRARISASRSSTGPRGTGGSDVITWVSSAAPGTQLLRATGGGGGGSCRGCGGGTGGREDTGPGSWNGADGGGAAR